MSCQNVGVIMAVDVEMTSKKDPDHLAYATEHNAVLVTFDRAFATLTSAKTHHTGLIEAWS
jgi:predicted nuclease of predicted toxin-antitoxin system